MNRISAKIVADSINKQGNRITTMEVVFPRIVLAEFNTHRLFTRNSASSRAIPIRKMLQSIFTNPFIPIAWQEEHTGMQGTVYLEGQDAYLAEKTWLRAMDYATQQATYLGINIKATKQLANRLLEPFMYHKVLVTFTESENFFNLRCPSYQFDSLGDQVFRSKKDVLKLNKFAASLSDLDWMKANKGMGEIHIMDLAEKMWDAMNENTPKLLQSGEWHIPYGDNINLGGDNFPYGVEDAELKISIARCARLSYQTLGENPKIDYLADLKLFNDLNSSKHYSPFEHVAKCMTELEYFSHIKGQVGAKGYLEDDTEGNYKGHEPKESDIFGWDANFRGFIQYRSILES